MSLEINVQIKRGYGKSVSKKWLQLLAQAALAAEKVAPPVELGIVVTDDSTVRRLNRFYRGKDKTTDVLSFALTEDAADTDFITPSDGVSRLGEVIISYPRAVAQAEEHGHSIEREIAWLLIHGILHLLGYDHQDDATEARMRQREEAILKEIDL
jgi:probable rRNA maturation factor